MRQNNHFHLWWNRIFCALAILIDANICVGFLPQ